MTKFYQKSFWKILLCLNLVASSINLRLLADESHPVEMDDALVQQEIQKLYKILEPLNIDTANLAQIERKWLRQSSTNSQPLPLIIGVTGVSNSGVSTLFNNITPQGIESQVSPFAGTTHSPTILVPSAFDSAKLNDVFSTTASNHKTVKPNYLIWDAPFIMIDLPGPADAPDFDTSLRKFDRHASFCDVMIVKVPYNYQSHQFIELLKTIHGNGTKVILALQVEKFNEADVAKYLEFFESIERSSKVVAMRKAIVETPLNPEPSSTQGAITRFINSPSTVSRMLWNAFGGPSSSEVIMVDALQSNELKAGSQSNYKEVDALIKATESAIDTYTKLVNSLHSELTLEFAEFAKKYNPENSGLLTRVDEVWQNSNTAIKFMRIPVNWIFKFLEMRSKNRHNIASTAAKKSLLETQDSVSRKANELDYLFEELQKNLRTIQKFRKLNNFDPSIQGALDSASERLIDIDHSFLTFFNASPQLAPKIDKRIKVSLLRMKRDRPTIYYTVLYLGDYGYRAISVAIGVGGPLAGFFLAPYLLPAANLGRYALFAPFLLHPAISILSAVGITVGYWYFKPKFDVIADYARVKLLIMPFLKGKRGGVLKYQTNWRYNWFRDWQDTNYLEKIRATATDTLSSLNDAKLHLEQLRKGCKESFKP